jgi:hypothetical protein
MIWLQAKLFTWTADPDKIIAAVKRGHQALDSSFIEVRCLSGPNLDEFPNKGQGPNHLIAVPSPQKFRQPLR